MGASFVNQYHNTDDNYQIILLSPIKDQAALHTLPYLHPQTIPIAQNLYQSKLLFTCAEISTGQSTTWR